MLREHLDRLQAQFVAIAEKEGEDAKPNLLPSVISSSLSSNVPWVGCGRPSANRIGAKAVEGVLFRLEPVRNPGVVMAGEVRKRKRVATDDVLPEVERVLDGAAGLKDPKRCKFDVNKWFAALVTETETTEGRMRSLTDDVNNMWVDSTATDELFARWK